MSKSKVFVGIAVSFALGILLASKFNIAAQVVYIFIAACVLGFALAFLSSRKMFAVFAVFLFFVGLGALRLQTSQVPSEFISLYDTKPKLEGYIVEDVDVRTDKQLLTIQPKGFGQNILATVPLSQSYFYGDWVTVEGKLTGPKAFDDFDYQKYLERFNVYAVTSYPKILILKNHQLNPIKEFLLRIKAGFASRIGSFIREPQASLLMGILIGARKTLPQTIIDNFNADGVSHIIAISGYNISVIIMALEYLARFLGRRLSFWLSVAVIFGFVILSGASASVIRAAVMGSLLLIAFNIGRQYSITPALFFAALIMLVINPKILFWDISFQLSFAATLGIVYFSPVLEKLTTSWPNPWQIKNILLTTMAAIVSTLPLILLYFGRLSLVAPAVNILILPFVPVTMLLGFLTVLPFVGPGFAFLANFLLVYMLNITEMFAKFRFSSVDVKISSLIFLGLILLVFGLYFGLRRLSARASVQGS
ncbi:MAG TPA: ComEC/Rec2 family competence protein [Candidatus Limnocylindria bacterium]|nr:ComEC/Rec2 family competence protein [Candidatus Limnocylindria bacterium]